MMGNQGQIVKIDLNNAAAWPVVPVAEVVKAGGVIIYPTDTIYGLGCSPYVLEAIERIYRIKGRRERKPMLVLLPEATWVARVAKDIPPLFFPLAGQFWPGPLTMVLKAKDDLPAALTAGTGTIGIRVPQQPFTRELVRRCEMPLVSTSANRSGRETVLHIQKLVDSFGRAVDMIVDAGDLASGVESTVISLVHGQVRPLREGRIPVAAIEQAFRRS